MFRRALSKGAVYGGGESRKGEGPLALAWIDGVHARYIHPTKYFMYTTNKPAVGPVHHGMEPLHVGNGRASETAADLGAQIAACLSGPARWVATSDRDGDGALRSDGATLTRKADGAAIHLRIGGYRSEGRVTFRACWPQFHDGRAYTPRAYLTITCRADHSPAALAREIERRLLPDYDAAYRAALDDVRASDAAAEGAARAADRIARAIGAALPRPGSYRRQRNGDAVDIVGAPESVYQLQVSPAYGDRPLGVSFRVGGIDEATALQVLAILAAANGEGGR